MTFAHFPHDEILELKTRLVSLGLEAKRSQLFGGVPRVYVAGLSQNAVPDGQVLDDLIAMNEVRVVVGGLVPIERYLQNAADLMGARPDEQQYFRDKVTRVTQPDNPPINALGEDVPAEMSIVPERIVHIDDKLSIKFVSDASQAARSVVRLRVPKIVGGAPQKFPFSDQEMAYFGTGWLLTPSLVVTNHHVVNARDHGEAAATEGDLGDQAQKTAVEFDYITEDVPGDFADVDRLVASNTTLDIAILRLKAPSDRTPLKLWRGDMSMPPGTVTPVNIIQHPGGAAKQIALWNNLAAQLTDRDLAYFTDTEGGSSGSPVCNDAWFVIALHKASTRGLGEFDFQGKSTAWVNIGTRVDKIIEYLQTELPEVWAEVEEVG